jgi:hypothetical protein
VILADELTDFAAVFSGLSDHSAPINVSLGDLRVLAFDYNTFTNGHRQSIIIHSRVGNNGSYTNSLAAYPYPGFVIYDTDFNAMAASAARTPAEVNPRQTFGILIGAIDDGWFIDGNGNKVNAKLRGDLAVRTLKDAILSTIPAAQLTTFEIDRTAGNFLSREAIAAEIMSLKGKINPGDELIFYVNSHGIRDNQRDANVDHQHWGDERFLIGEKILDQGNLEVLGHHFSDDDLAKVLAELDPDGLIAKSVFLDVCYSGGFWDTGIDPIERQDPHDTDLNGLKNIALFAASTELVPAWGNDSGFGYYTSALNAEIRSGGLVSGSRSDLAIRVHDILKKFKVVRGDYFYQLSPGDRVPADPSLFSPVFFSDEEYLMTTARAVSEPTDLPVAEPSMLSVILLGLCMLFFSRQSDHGIVRRVFGDRPRLLL